MKLVQKLHNVLDKHKGLLQEYEEVVKEFEDSDLYNENIKLQKEIEECKNTINEVKQKNDELSQENKRLRIALKEQIVDEKLNILKISTDKIDLYFKNLSEEYSNGLLELEGKAKQKLEHLKNVAYKELIETNDEFYQEVDKLNTILKGKIERNRQEFSKQKDDALKDVQEDVEKLSSQDVSDEMLEKRAKQNDLEIKIGLNWINKIGIFLILLGVAYVLKYSYTEWFNDYMRSAFSFMIGGVFLAAGEWFYKKNKHIFAKGLIGGGIGILYYAVFAATFIFNFESFNMNTALLVSVLVTITALLLSIRYNSQTISGLSLIGGYLPFFTYVFKYGLADNELYFAMGYLFILNLLVLIISFNKNWSVIKFISFTLNVPSLIYLVYDVPKDIVGILYSVLTFGMYLLIILAYPFKNLKQKLSLKYQDLFLLALNTFISCVVIYWLFEKAGFEDYKGILALIFSLIYFGLGQFVNNRMDEDKNTQGLFYLTSLTFAVLIIPFQFGVNWIVLGWLIEGTLLTIYGYKNEIVNFERAGWAIVGLCTLAFYYICLIGLDINYFDVNYLGFIVGIVSILFTYLTGMRKDTIQKYSFKGQLINYFKYFTLINVWIYIVYTTGKLYNQFINIHYYDDFYKILLFALFTILTGYVISKISILRDKVVEYFVCFLYLVSIAIFFIINAFYGIPTYDPYLYYVSLSILILSNLIVLLTFKDIIIRLIKETRTTLEIYPLCIAAYLLVTITAILIEQFNLGDENLLFSLLYVLLSFAYITYGFSKDFVMIRRFGLGLLVFSVGKLFIYDLAFLDIEGKIIAYFGFGFTMLAISYVYQRVKNKLDTDQSIQK